MAIDPHIFRAYDIRGKAHVQLSEEACRLIGKGFGSMLRERYKKDHPSVVVGRDARSSGPALERALIEGLTSAGCHVVAIGETPSPVNYCTICHLDLDGGVQVTASHNPAEDNGLKLQVRGAAAFAGEDLQMLRRRIEAGIFSEGKGAAQEIDVLGAYADTIAGLLPDAAKGLLIVVDSGNGVAGPAYCKALRRAGAEVLELYTEPDGRFPNHAADPSRHATLEELQETVVKTGARAGLAFDGDGDRLGIVDERGKIRSADEILLLLAEDHLSRHPGKPVVFTTSNSGILDTEIRSFGGKPVLCKVGHSFVEHAMREEGSLLGGEQSGHFFVAEKYYGFDDALVAGLTVLKILTQKGVPLSELFGRFPAIFQAKELRPHCADDKKESVIRAVMEHFSKNYPVMTLDGARIDFGDGALAGVRQSNTSPCLSICMEARNLEDLKRVEEIVIGYMKEFKEVTWEK